MSSIIGNRFGGNGQRGGSAIVILIVLALIGVAIYIGIQYVPQRMESGTIDTILDSVQQTYDATPVRTREEVEDMIARRLEINEMRDMQDAFQVEPKGDGFEITVSYQRELDLLYETLAMPYEKTLVLTP